MPRLRSPVPVHYVAIARSDADEGIRARIHHTDMTAEEPRIYVLLIENDAPVMRTMAWALTENGFDVEVVSQVAALAPSQTRAPDAAVFNMSGSREEKSAFNRSLRALNPHCIIIDVDQFQADGARRDIQADDYVERPANLDTLTSIINELSALTSDERRDLRDKRDDDVRRDHPDEQP
jgi:ActR/RegA family two-component response regulator